MSQKRKATHDAGLQPSKKTKTEHKSDQTLKPQETELVGNKVRSSHRTLFASKVKQKKNQNSSVKSILQKNIQTDEAKGVLSSNLTRKATVTGEQTLSSKNKLSIHRPSKQDEVSCNWKQLLKSGKVVHNKKTLQKNESLEKQEQLKKSNDSSKSNEIWFDGVDEILLETGKMPEPVSTDKPEADSLVKPNAFEGLTKVVAMDCEMVGVGLEGKDSVLARVSIVNHFGQCLYDKYAKPLEEVTDYRTFVSGIRPSDLKNAEDFKIIQKEVSDLLNGRILVGHAIHNDLKVLFLDHPRKKIRDTSCYKPFRALIGGGIPSLKKLSEKLLSVKIQDGEHSSVQDARAAMRLYTMHRKKWESSIKKKN